MNKKLTDVERIRQANEARQSAYQKNKLIEIITKKVQTTMIGALASFEKSFGHLWGLGKFNKELSISQKELKQRWEETRNEILNRGNANIRSIQEELSLYNLKKENYRIDFIIKKPNNTNTGE